MSGYIGADITEQTKTLIQQQAAMLMVASAGNITSLDPKKYTAKVMLQPLGVETGWLPIGALYAGNGFGLMALPAEGTEVLVVFEQGNLNVGRIILASFNKVNQPPDIQPGEFAIFHESESYLKFGTDGTVYLSPKTTIELAGGGAAVARSGDPVSVSVPGIGTCTGTITGGSAKVTSG